MSFSASAYRSALRSSRVVGRFWVGPNFRYTIANCPVSRLMQASRSPRFNAFNNFATVATGVAGVGLGVGSVVDAARQRQSGKIGDLQFALKMGGGLLGIMAGPASMFGAFSRFHAVQGQYTAFAMAGLGMAVEGANAGLIIKEANRPFDPAALTHNAALTAASQDLAMAAYGFMASAPVPWSPAGSALLNLGSMLVTAEQARRNDVFMVSMEGAIGGLGAAMRRCPNDWDLNWKRYRD